MEKDNLFISILMFFLGIALIFELTILGIAFFGADKVECNFLWCSFTTTNNHIDEKTFISTHQSCSVNGKEVNCSNFYNEYKYSASRFNESSINGICESDNWTLCVEQAIKIEKERLNNK